MTEASQVKIEQRIAKKYLSLMHSASSRNKEFNLSLQSVRNLLNAKKCYFTGKRLSSSTLTIDRVNNEKGYVKGNVVACHASFNTKKSNFTMKEIEMLYKKTRRFV